MSHATVGGATRRGGDRGLTRRRLIPYVVVASASLMVVAHVGMTRAASDAEAWLSARQVHAAGSAAIGTATAQLAEGGSAADVRHLRETVAATIVQLDALEVHDCFRVWWSYVRTSYLLFDQALLGLEKGDFGQVQSAVASSRWLAAMAEAVQVDCPDRGVTPARIGDARIGGGYLATAQRLWPV